MAKRYLLRHHLAFTTAYHTRFPEIGAELAEAQWHIPPALAQWVGYTHVKKFHHHSAAVMVALPSLAHELTTRGFSSVALWSRGIDHHTFFAGGDTIDLGPGPIFMHYGRLSLDKGFPQFCALRLPGTLVAVGDGPPAEVARWKKEFPRVRFMGRADGAMRGTFLRSATVMVFLSTTDTFGLTTIEANACGTPVAAIDHFPHTDLIQNGLNGWALRDVHEAAKKAASFTSAERHRTALSAQKYTWEKATTEFLAHLVPIHKH